MQISDDRKKAGFEDRSDSQRGSDSRPGKDRSAGSVFVCSVFYMNRFNASLLHQYSFIDLPIC